MWVFFFLPFHSLAHFRVGGLAWFDLKLLWLIQQSLFSLSLTLTESLLSCLHLFVHPLSISIFWTQQPSALQIP